MKVEHLREIPILSSHSQIQDEVELLIKRRIQVSTAAPWILHQGPVGGIGGELATLPHALPSFEGPVGDLLLGLSDLSPHSTHPNETNALHQ